MKCPWCDPPVEVKKWDAEIEEHLVVTIDWRGHVHVHGPRDDARDPTLKPAREIVRKMVHQIYNDYELWRKDPHAQMRGKAEGFKGLPEGDNKVAHLPTNPEEDLKEGEPK